MNYCNGVYENKRQVKVYKLKEIKEVQWEICYNYRRNLRYVEFFNFNLFGRIC